MNEDMAVTKLLTGNKVAELRNLGAFAYRIKCKKTEGNKNMFVGRIDRLLDESERRKTA